MEKIKKIFKDEKVGVSAQALRFLDQLEDKENVSKEMAKEIKKREIVIGGADVLFYMKNKRFPTSPSINSEEL